MEAAWLWLLPALPLLGALLIAAFGRKSDRLVSTLAIAAVVGAFAVALFALLTGSPLLTQHLWTVIDTGGVRVDAALALDRLSILLVLVITGIGALIHVYSVSYMAGDAAYWRFFAAMNLFVSAMLVLVLADNLALMFAGWEGVGLCSWLLIGFWHRDPQKVLAANRAFLVNRLGDVGLVAGILVLFWTPGVAPTFVFRALSEQLELQPTPGGATLACLLIFAGAAAKSAQLPFHGWLPDAMAGPTPVSALIHAATMVTAGVYLLVRLAFLLEQSADAMLVVACVGAATALYAAACALAQTDFKRVLAYSTISQLGFMFLAVGVGAWWAAIFHLVTHAFFKAALFLGAGAVLHQTHHEQDLRRLGGLHHRLPWVSRAYAICALALAGVPLAGSFFSKDFILHAAFGSGGGVGVALWAAASLAALGTSLYAWRSWSLAFSGTWRGAHEAPGADAPALMRWVLALLCVGAVGTAALALPTFDDWLEPAIGAGRGSRHTLGSVTSAALIAIAIAVALGGVLLASRLWASGPRAPSSPRLLAFIEGGWGFDRLYQLGAQGMIATAAKLGAFDRLAIDGLVDAIAALTRYLCMFEAAFDYYVIDGMVHLVGQISMRTGKSLRSLQSGDLMRYLYVAVAGALIVICLQYWMRAR